MSDVSEQISLQNAEKEKQQEIAASDELLRQYSLPKNISDMKSFAWGRFTWRDVIVGGASFLVPIMLMMAFQRLIPTYICVLIGVAIGIPFFIIGEKHLFTGDLPIEEKIRIYIENAGASNLLSWDKTKLNGKYVPSSTQSFVPDVFIDKNDYVMVNGGHGGFAIDQIDVEDSTTAKAIQKLSLYNNFKAMLNQCIDSQKEIPIQFYMQATLVPLQNWIANSVEDLKALNNTDKTTMQARAMDYFGVLNALDMQERYTYKYYMITTYRDDAEGVGDKSMNTSSVRREQLKENANPFKKKMDAAAAVDYQIGDDRAKKTKEYLKANQFGQLRTKIELDQRLMKTENAVNLIGSNHLGVQARKLKSADISKLFYEFFNATDKYTATPILQQALQPKVALYSKTVYDDFPDIFKNPNDKHDISELFGGQNRLGSANRANKTAAASASKHKQKSMPNIPTSFIQEKHTNDEDNGDDA